LTGLLLACKIPESKTGRIIPTVGVVRMKKPFLAPLLAAACMGTSAHAAVQTFTVPYSSFLINVPMFDPALGTLNSAKLTITGHLEFPFNDATRAPASGPYSYSAFYSFYYLGTYLDIGVSGAGTANFGAGPILYLGADGSEAGFLPVSRLPFVQGLSTWNGSIAVDPPHTLMPNDGTIIPASDEPIFVSGTLTVDYAYIAAAVPEPAVWSMMIGGFAVTGAFLRRRKVAVSFA
jgi:hypothetical protein